MKSFLLLLLTLAFSSCLTVEKIQRNCDKFAQVCVTDRETNTVIEYRDTTIYIDRIIKVPVPMFTDSVRIRDSVNVITVINETTNEKEQYCELSPIHREVGLIGVDAWVNHSVIEIYAYLLDSTILVPYKDSVVAQNQVTTTTTENNIKLPHEKYKTWFTRFCTWWFFITIIGGILLGLWKFGIILTRLRP